MPVVNDLENLLRHHKDRLCVEAAARYRHAVRSDHAPTQADKLAQAGAEYTHELVLIASALYPSDISLRNQYKWASTGRLRQYGIGFDQQLAMLRGYFYEARQLAELRPAAQQALDSLEQFMSSVLMEVFHVDQAGSTT